MLNKTNMLALAISVVLAVGFVLAGPASGQVVRHTYDFDHLNIGSLDGQDGWIASADLEVAADPMGGAPDPGSENCITYWGGTDAQYATRSNDANWGFDLSGDSQFAFGNSIATDYNVSEWYGYGKSSVENTVTGRSVAFGIKILPWYYAPYIQDALGDHHTGGQPRPMARNQIWDFKLEVDAAAYGGGGSGSLYAKQRGVYPDWVPVSGLQDVNLSLATAGADILAANQIRLDVQMRLVAFDDLWVEGVPEPATVEIDVRPGSWPNPLNTKSKGVLPLAVCGTEDLDVTTIDPGTILLGREGFDQWLAPLRWSVEDVATPYDNGEPGGHDLDGDGLPDLALKFSTEELAALLGLGGEAGNTIPLTLTGTLTDEAGGLEFEGLDWIWVLRTGDANLDGFVDIQDFFILKDHFGLGAGWSEGDFNEDGIVDIQDFSLLKANFGQGGAGLEPAPEPASAVLLLIGLPWLTCLAGRRIRRRSRR